MTKHGRCPLPTTTCWAAGRGLPPCAPPEPPVLDTPDVRSHAGHDCAVAAYRTVVGYFTGTPAAPADWGTEWAGGHPAYLLPQLRLAGLRCQDGEMDLADLAYHTGRNRPVIVLVRLDGVGHYAVVRGVDARGRVHLQDPERGRVTLGKRAFGAAWHDTDNMGTRFLGYGIACERK